MRKLITGVDADGRSCLLARRDADHGGRETLRDPDECLPHLSGFRRFDDVGGRSGRGRGSLRAGPETLGTGGLLLGGDRATGAEQGCSRQSVRWTHRVLPRSDVASYMLAGRVPI